MSSVTCGNGVDMRTWSRTKSMFVIVAWCAPKALSLLGVEWPHPYWYTTPTFTADVLCFVETSSTWTFVTRMGQALEWNCPTLASLSSSSQSLLCWKISKGKRTLLSPYFFFSNVAPKNEVCREKLIKSSAVISSSLLKVTCSMFIPLL